MNPLSLVGPWLDNIYQIRRKWYYSSGWNFLRSKQGPDLIFNSKDLNHLRQQNSHICRRIHQILLVLLFLAVPKNIFILEIFYVRKYVQVQDIHAHAPVVW
jgi:hypothetical protein